MIYLEDLLGTAPRTGARVFGPIRSRTFDGFAHDPCKVRPGELFVAIRTATGDGHDHVEQACRRGAAGVLVAREVDLAAFGATVVVVDDTSEALKAWASRILERHAPLVVGVTGSVGKSSTRKAIVSVLGQGDAGAPAVFDNDDLNSLLGLPIALGGLEPSHRVAVLELVTDIPGEMAELAALARPTIAVVTNVYPSAVPHPDLAEPADLVAELSEIVRSLPPDGCAILNRDDPLVLGMAARTSAPVVTFGCDDSAADVRAEEVHELPDGLTFALRHGADRAPVRLHLLGRPGLYAGLAAAAVGVARGLGLSEIAAGLESLRPLRGRLRPLSGVGESLLLDDSLSSSLPSVTAALDVLEHLPARRKLVVLGGALTGVLADDERRRLGRKLARTADRLVIKGEQGEEVARAALAEGLPADRLTITHTAGDAAASVLAADLGSGDVVLVKGSEESRMELVVERLLAKPADAPDLLVRQDVGWKRRVVLSRERPTWVEIDLAGIGHNVRRIKEIVGPGVEVMAVVKADAYGHGAVRVARTALLHGATALATACLGEATALRERGITAPILILGYTPPWQASEIVRHGLTATVFSREVAQHLSQAAVGQRRAPTPVHVKVDTGMGRLGLQPADVAPFVEEIRGLPGLDVQGIFTHFATADSADQAYARRQLDAFRAVLDGLAARGITFRYVHAANSAAILTLPEAHFSMVRLGLAMHGLDPSPEVRCPPDFRRALAFKTQVAQVKLFPPGSCISYGCRFVTTRPSRIAVIPVGYGDGFRRSPRNWGEVLVRGRRAPIVGTVCMDMCMIDVTEIPDVRPGDEVVLIGRQGEESITAEDVADRLGTINYEVVTQILARVPREVAPAEVE